MPHLLNSGATQTAMASSPHPLAHAPCLFLAPRRKPARPVTASPSCWRGTEVERRGAGAALGTVAEASGMASAALRRPRRDVARGCSMVGGLPGRPSKQWSAPSRRDPDNRRCPLLLLLPLAALPSSRRREESYILLLIPPAPSPTSPGGEGITGYDAVNTVMGVGIVALTEDRVSYVVRVFAAAPSSRRPPAPLSPPPVSSVRGVRTTTRPPATPTNGTSGTEPLSRGRGKEHISHLVLTLMGRGKRDLRGMMMLVITVAAAMVTVKGIR